MLENLKMIFFTLFLKQPKKQGLNVIFPIRLLSKNFSLKREIDYYCYAVFVFLLVLGFIISAILVLSTIFDTKILYEPMASRLNVISSFSMIMGPLSFLAALAFYVRKRFSIDLKKTELTFIANPKIVEGKGKGVWLRWSFSLLLITLVLMFGAHFFPIYLVLHYGWENNIFLIWIVLLIPLFIVPFGAALFVYAALMVEKIIRYFPEIINDFHTIQFKDTA